MFSAPPPLAAHGCQDQRQTAFLSRAVATAGTGGVWAFFHETNVHQTDDTVIPKGTYADTYSMKPSNPQSAQPMPSMTFSKRAQALLQPAKNQIVLPAKGQADKTRSIQRGGI